MNDRIIKFRKWNDINGGWLPHDVLAKWPIGIFDVRGDLQQFTGLHDKNGKEIYEGDVVRTLADVGNCVVGWHGNHYGMGFACEDKDGAIVDFEDDWSDMEVIGNIYENPELLK